jgi:ATP-dependent RNA helicase RhlE
VHRIGRTGRAGANGSAIAFCDAEEKEYLRDIQRLIGLKIPEMENLMYPLLDNTVAKAAPKAQRAPRSSGSRNGYGRNNNYGRYN